MPNLNIFTPGPSAMYPMVKYHVTNAFKENVPSISHRSGEFKKIFEECVTNLKELLQIPDNYEIVFTGSATEIWERIIQNQIEKSSTHIVHGSFSKRFYETALDYNIQAQAITSRAGTLPDLAGMKLNSELLAVIHNETSTGVTQPMEDIYALRSANPNVLIAIDAVSSLPYAKLDFDKIDTAYFSVQKGFGLPAGLGVWLVNDRCIEKANKKLEKGISIGSYHSLPSLIKQAKRFQTPETPNVLGIYLLAKVANDMLKKGIDQIRKETEYKSNLLYFTAQNHSILLPFVKKEKWRSKTIFVGECKISSTEIISKLKKKGLLIGAGYGDSKTTQIRIANFPAHSKEQIEMLVDAINEINYN